MKKSCTAVQGLLGAWGDFRKKNGERIKQGMQFSYGDKKEVKETIGEALLFWKFVQLHLSSYHTWKARRDFLKNFLNARNPLIKVVAMIESLPTSVWRKLLWKENIDFMDFESFLRRLTHKQADAIRKSFEELFVDSKIPTIFSRWMVFFKKITTEKLLKESLDFVKRYTRKGAMSYNLSDLDFGFNAYPKGVSNDTKVVEISPLRFLSKKEHAEDFVVNTEDGKYWWLYKKARSNYVWNSGMYVELNTHICPGFWYTFIMHLLFWIISPLCAITASGLFLEGTAPWYITVAVAIPGLMTTLWLFAALLKFIFTNTLSERFLNGIGNSWEKYKDKIFKVAFYIFIVIISTAVVGISWHFVWPVLLKCFEVFGVLGTSAAIALIGLYVVSLFERYDSYAEEVDAFKTASIFLKIPIFFLAICFTIKAITMYPWVFGYVFLLALNFIVTWWKIEAVFALLIVLSIAISYADKLPRKTIDRLDRVIYTTATPILCIAVLIMTVLIVYAAIFSQVGFLFLAVALIAFIWFSILVFACYRFNPKMVKLEDTINETGLSHFLNAPLIRKNSWLYYMDSIAMNVALNQVYKISSTLFYKQKERKKFMQELIPILTSDLLEKLEKDAEVLSFLESKEIWVALKMLFAGKSIKKAKEKAFEKRRKQQAFDAKIEAITAPITNLFEFIDNILIKIVEYAQTAKRIYQFFNERCPYVVQPKVLTFEEEQE